MHTAKYGINEKKKANVSALTDKVTKLQFRLAQQQSVVESLTQKSAEFTGSLVLAEKKRELASSQLELAVDVVSRIKNIKRKTNLVNKQTDKSGKKIVQTVSQMTTLVKQVIFTVEIVNKLVALVQKKKNAGAIISSELSDVMANASTNANNAVAATLLALRSCHVAMATSEECSQLSEQEVRESIDLYALITGDSSMVHRYKAMRKATNKVNAMKTAMEDAAQQNADAAYANVEELLAEENNQKQLAAELDADIASFDSHESNPQPTSLLTLITQADHAAKYNYNLALSANNRVTRELEEAKSKMAKTSVELASLEAGLSAANAAAAIV